MIRLKRVLRTGKQLTMSNKFTIGAGKDDYPGVAKLLEEVGEFSQVAGKLIATDGDPNHWDGDGNLIDRLVDEVADMKAAIAWIEAKCGVVALSFDYINERVKSKLANYHRFADDERGAARVPSIGHRVSKAATTIVPLNFALIYVDTNELTIDYSRTYSIKVLMLDGSYVIIKELVPKKVADGVSEFELRFPFDKYIKELVAIEVDPLAKFVDTVPTLEVDGITDNDT